MNTPIKRIAAALSDVSNSRGVEKGKVLLNARDISMVVEDYSRLDTAVRLQNNNSLGQEGKSCYQCPHFVVMDVNGSEMGVCPILGITKYISKQTNFFTTFWCNHWGTVSASPDSGAGKISEKPKGWTPPAQNVSRVRHDCIYP